MQGWQDISLTEDLLSRPYGLVFDEKGNLWAVDGLGDLIMQFNINAK